MMRTLLITGAAGFVGSSVARHARARGHKVIGLDIRQAVEVDESVIADVSDRPKVAAAAGRCDGIIHCAAIVGPSPAMADPVLATRVNVDGTLAVLEAARELGLRVVCLSTATLYGNDSTAGTNDETRHPEPVGLYDATKLMAETLCEAYSKSFQTDVASIRTSFVYGAGHSTGDYFVERVLEGEQMIEARGRDHPCEFTYVEDLAEGLLQAVEAPALAHSIYNIAAGCTRTRGELAAIVMHHFPRVRIHLEEGLDPGRHHRGPCRIERAREDIGFRPRFSLEEGIADWIGRVQP